MMMFVICCPFKKDKLFAQSDKRFNMKNCR